MSDKVTFYNVNGDPVEIENTPKNVEAMEKAGFSKTKPVQEKKLFPSFPKAKLKNEAD